MKNHTFSIAALLLGALLVGFPSASACTNTLPERCTYPEPADGPIQSGGAVDCATFDPGAPSSGVVPETLWYANSNAEALCQLAEAAQNSALRTGGNAAWMVGLTVVDAGGMLGNDPSPDEFAATTEARATFVVLSTPSAVGPVATATFEAASTALDSTCVYLTSQTPCV